MAVVRRDVFVSNQAYIIRIIAIRIGMVITQFLPFQYMTVFASIANGIRLSACLSVLEIQFKSVCSYSNTRMASILIMFHRQQILLRLPSLLSASALTSTTRKFLFSVAKMIANSCLVKVDIYKRNAQTEREIRQTKNIIFQQHREVECETLHNPLLTNSPPPKGEPTLLVSSWKPSAKAEAKENLCCLVDIQ